MRGKNNNKKSQSQESIKFHAELAKYERFKGLKGFATGTMATYPHVELRPSLWGVATSPSVKYALKNSKVRTDRDTLRHFKCLRSARPVLAFAHKQQQRTETHPNIYTNLGFGHTLSPARRFSQQQAGIIEAARPGVFCQLRVDVNVFQYPCPICVIWSNAPAITQGTAHRCIPRVPPAQRKKNWPACSIQGIPLPRQGRTKENTTEEITTPSHEDEIIIKRPNEREN